MYGGALKNNAGIPKGALVKTSIGNLNWNKDAKKKSNIGL